LIKELSMANNEDEDTVAQGIEALFAPEQED